MNEPSGAVSEREIIVTRTFAAPRDLVFQMWTEPEHVTRWWGPQGFSIQVLEMDVRPGGVWRFIMRSPDGKDYPNRIVYQEVIRPERLAYTHGADSDDADDSHGFQTTVTFTESDRKTHVSLRMLFPTAAARDKAVKEIGAIEGANQTLSRLQDYLDAYHVNAGRHDSPA